MLGYCKLLNLVGTYVIIILNLVFFFFLTLFPYGANSMFPRFNIAKVDDDHSVSIPRVLMFLAMCSMFPALEHQTLGIMNPGNIDIASFDTQFIANEKKKKEEARWVHDERQKVGVIGCNELDRPLGMETKQK